MTTLVKFNPYHDEFGRFTTADNAVVMSAYDMGYVDDEYTIAETVVSKYKDIFGREADTIASDIAYALESGDPDDLDPYYDPDSVSVSEEEFTSAVYEAGIDAATMYSDQLIGVGKRMRDYEFQFNDYIGELDSIGTPEAEAAAAYLRSTGPFGYWDEQKSEWYDRVGLGGESPFMLDTAWQQSATSLGAMRLQLGVVEAGLAPESTAEVLRSTTDKSVPPFGGMRKAATAIYEDTQARLVDLGWPETVTMYRGSVRNVDADDGGNADITTRPVSSWTLNPYTAQEFAAGGGIVMSASIPRDQIFSLGSDGMGSVTESELLVLGTDTRRVKVVDVTDVHVENQQIVESYTVAIGLMSDAYSKLDEVVDKPDPADLIDMVGAWEAEISELS